MRRPDVGWEIESEVKFPSRAFCQVESLPDGFLKIRLRNRHLQIQRFDRRALLDGIIGFVQLFFCFHGIWVFCRITIVCDR
jgi:hypothetical protein